MRINVDQGRRTGETHSCAIEVVVAPHQVHEVAGFAGPDDAEPAGQAKSFGVRGHVTVGHGVESAAPRPAVPLPRHQVGGPGEHLVGGPPREGEQQDPFGSCSSIDERSHPGHQCPCLARPRPGHDHQGAVTVVGHGQLGVVEALVPSGRGEHMFAP